MLTERTPLSIEKCCVLHRGTKQQHHAYLVNEKLLKLRDSFADLGGTMQRVGL